MKGNFDNAVIGPRHIKKYLLIIDQFEYGIEPVGWTEFAKMHLCFHSGVYESDELTRFRASRVESRSNTTLQLVLYHCTISRESRRGSNAIFKDVAERLLACMV